MRRIMAMLNNTGDPVADAERHQQYLEEAYPDREGAVRMTLDVWVNVKGGTEVELKEAAYQTVKEIMQDKRINEWDFTFGEVETEECISEN